MMRTFAAAALIITVVAGVSGCATPIQHEQRTATRASDGPTGGVKSPTAAHRNVPIPDGIVATATLTSSSGAALGSATIVKTGDQWELKLPDLDLGDPESVLPVLADSPFSPGACGSDNVWEAAFLRQDGFPMTLDISPYSGDPSFFTVLMLVRYGGQTQPTPDASGCIQPILATAPIAWTVPDQRPWVTTVTDAGESLGARGSVQSENGAPSVYVTASGDTWGRIAARFGLTADDLTWLNPNRLGGGMPGEAYAQQLLNLDPDNRGNSESRRPH